MIRPIRREVAPGSAYRWEAIRYALDSTPRTAQLGYVAFTIGMTYQVSDTTLRNPRLRRTVLAHAILSYLFGVVIVAGSAGQASVVSKPSSAGPQAGLASVPGLGTRSGQLLPIPPGASIGPRHDQGASRAPEDT